MRYFLFLFRAAVFRLIGLILKVLKVEDAEDAEDPEDTEDSRDLNKERKERLLDIMSEPEICLEDRDLTIDAANVPPNVNLSKADIEGGPQMPGQDEDSIHQTIMKQVRNLKHL